MSRKHVVKATVYDKKGRKLGEAYNSYTSTHPLQAHFASLVGKPDAVFLHAEILAILRAGDKKIHRLHIERYQVNGAPALAAPCPICRKAIAAFDIEHITYTF